MQKPKQVKTDKITEYNMDMLPHSHCFKKGHKIMVHIQSSWFTLIEMNPQQFIPIKKAKPKDYRKVTQKSITQ